MKTPSELKDSVRQWVLKNNKKISPDELDNTTPLLEKRIISSLQIMDLILFLESLQKGSISVENLNAESFASIDAIYTHFLEKK